MKANQEACYACTFIEKTSEVDDFEKGCEGKRNTVLADKCNVTAPTVFTLIEELQRKFFVTVDYLFIPDAKNGVQYISCSQLETADGMEPSEQEKERWKRGEVILYICDYTFHIERRITSPVDFEEFRGLGIPIEM